jgi:hypothetical protein
MTIHELAKRIRSHQMHNDLRDYLAATLAELREDYEARTADEFTRGKIDLIKSIMKDIK